MDLFSLVKRWSIALCKCVYGSYAGDRVKLFLVMISYDFYQPSPSHSLIEKGRVDKMHRGPEDLSYVWLQ